MTDDERCKRILAHYARAPRVSASWFKAYLEALAHKS